jgi:hypothetical protein
VVRARATGSARATARASRFSGSPGAQALYPQLPPCGNSSGLAGLEQVQRDDRRCCGLLCRREHSEVGDDVYDDVAVVRADVGGDLGGEFAGSAGIHVELRGVDAVADEVCLGLLERRQT